MAQGAFTTTNRVPKVTAWEKNLADIIEQTNRNLSCVSKQGTHHDENKKKIHTNVAPSICIESSISSKDAIPVPPPRPCLKKTTRQSSSEAYHHHPLGVPVVINSGSKKDDDNLYIFQDKCDGVKSFLYHHQEEAHKFLLHGGIKRASISRPFEDDLTKKLSHAVLRSVEKAIAEDKHAAQRRMDKLNDKLEHLSEESRKIYKHYSSFSRTLISQDRLGKRLKDEWEKQRKALKRLDDAHMRDLGWKEATNLDLKLIKDQMAKDTSSVHHVSALEMRNAMDAVTTKTMIAVDKATTMSKQSLDAEISSLKRVVEALKQENNGLRCEIASCQEICTSLVVGKFDENHVSQVVFQAFQDNLSQLKQDIVSEMRASIVDDAKTSIYHHGHAHYLTTTVTRRIIADSVKEIINEKEPEIMDSVKRELMNELHERLEKANIDSGNYIKKEIRQSMDCFLKANSLCLDNAENPELKKQNVHDKSESLIELVPTATQSIGSAVSHNDELLPFMQDFESVKSTVDRIVKEIETVSENLSDRNNKFEHLNKDIPLIYDAIDNKFANFKRDYWTCTITEIQSNYESMKRLLNERLEFPIARVEELSRRLDGLERFDSISSNRTTMQDTKQSKHTTHDRDHSDGVTTMNSAMMEMMTIVSNLRHVEDSLRRLEDELGAIKRDLEVLAQEKVDSRLKDEEDENYRTAFIGIDNIELDRKVLQLVEKGQSEIERKIGEVNNMMRSLRKEINTINDKLIENDVMNRKEISSFVDIASCYGKVSSLENKMQNELERIKADYIDLQKNIIEMNNTSMDRIDFIASQRGWNETQTILGGKDVESVFLHNIEKRVDDQLKLLEDKITRMNNEMTLNLGQTVERKYATLSDQLLNSNAKKEEENINEQSKHDAVLMSYDIRIRQNIDDILRRLEFVESKIEDDRIGCRTNVDGELSCDTLISSINQTHPIEENEHVRLTVNKNNKVTTSGDESHPKAVMSRSSPGIVDTRNYCTLFAAPIRDSAPENHMLPLNPDSYHSSSINNESLRTFPTKIDPEDGEGTLRSATISNDSIQDEMNSYTHYCSSVGRLTDRNDSHDFQPSSNCTTSQQIFRKSELSFPSPSMEFDEGSSDEDMATEQVPVTSSAGENRNPRSDDFTKKTLCDGGDDHATQEDRNDVINCSSIASGVKEMLSVSMSSSLLSISESTPGSLAEEECDDIEVLSKTNNHKGLPILNKAPIDNDVENISNNVCRKSDPTNEPSKAQRVPSLVYTKSDSPVRAETSSLFDKSCDQQASTYRGDLVDSIQYFSHKQLENLVAHSHSETDSLSITESIKENIEEYYVRNEEHVLSCDKIAHEVNVELKSLIDVQDTANSIVSDSAESNQQLEKAPEESKLSCNLFEINDASSNSYDSSFECES